MDKSGAVPLIPLQAPRFELWMDCGESQPALLPFVACLICVEWSCDSRSANIVVRGDPFQECTGQEGESNLMVSAGTFFFSSGHTLDTFLRSSSGLVPVLALMHLPTPGLQGFPSFLLSLCTLLLLLLFVQLYCCATDLREGEGERASESFCDAVRWCMSQFYSWCTMEVEASSKLDVHQQMYRVILKLLPYSTLVCLRAHGTHMYLCT